MKPIRKSSKKEVIDKIVILKAVERSAEIEGLSLQSAQANLKVIAELQKHGRAFAL
ncbi:MAG: hypothetical protein HYV33_05185 [Candidatus Kerfeldbacteria bacterium]|nr:hypothetical protein [Candidatus Kerfeldbacteria bacterium]